jgi:iron complex transport system substrate-binding protein
LIRGYHTHPGKTRRDNRAMRVASLVPSGTLMLRALGVEPVGVSHSCPNPTGLPVLTESLIPEGLSQEEIDQRVREAYREGLSLYRVRGEVLSALAPDLLLGLPCKGRDNGCIFPL